MMVMTITYLTLHKFKTTINIKAIKLQTASGAIGFHQLIIVAHAASSNL